MGAGPGIRGAKMKLSLILITVLAAFIAGTAIWTRLDMKDELYETRYVDLPFEGKVPSFEGATGWLNTPPLDPRKLRGKVVLVQFWTYTCINWLRTEPYIRAWSEKYKDKGLVVIGVHTPEFEFEKDLDNVRRSVKDMKIDYPVAIDSNYKVWDAFTNRYWPALYFIDAKGDIRHHQFGEGDYELSEKVIRKLLAEAGNNGVDAPIVPVKGEGAEAAPDWESLRSGENYTGYGRTNGFSSPGGPIVGKSAAYILPARLDLNQWGLTGEWSTERGSVRLNKAGGRMAYKFHARDLHLVMGPLSKGASVRFRVLIDGQEPGRSHGTDTDERGNGTVSEQRLYQLVRQPSPIADRLFEIEFLDPGIEAFVFTFG